MNLRDKNTHIGDPAVGWKADHVESAVSIKFSGDQNAGLNTLACVRDEAFVVTGDAKGEKGVVTGKHGGIEHVLVDFPLSAMEKMVIGDKILIKAFGVGLKLLDFPDVKVMNISPDFLEKIKLDQQGDMLVVPVTHKIPACIVGSGISGNNPIPAIMISSCLMKKLSRDIL